MLSSDWVRIATFLTVFFFFSLSVRNSLKAEWMYSQSKGRHFAPGQQQELLDYLAETCPLHPDEDWQVRRFDAKKYM